MQIDTQKNMNIILLHPSRQCVYLEKSSCVLSVQGYGGALLVLCATHTHALQIAGKPNTEHPYLYCTAGTRAR